MSYRTILVHLDTDSDPGVRVGYARDLALEFDAYLVGFAGCGVRPVIAGDGGVPVDGEYMVRLQKQNRDRLRELQDAFMELARDEQNTIWRQHEGPPTDSLIGVARGADLVVSGTPSFEGLPDHFRSPDMGSLLCRTGRPVLLAAEQAKWRRPRKAIIGWKDTAESRRSIMASLPLLKLSEETVVVCVVGTEEKADESELGDVVRHLMRHGVNARQLVEEGGDAASTFVDVAKRENADFTVSGAYGHSRVRQWIFGGFTRNILEENGINRLFMG